MWFSSFNSGFPTESAAVLAVPRSGRMSRGQLGSAHLGDRPWLGIQKPVEFFSWLINNAWLILKFHLKIFIEEHLSYDIFPESEG